jgi:hypothetical protein
VTKVVVLNSGREHEEVVPKSGVNFGVFRRFARRIGFSSTIFAAVDGF